MVVLGGEVVSYERGIPVGEGSEGVGVTTACGGMYGAAACSTCTTAGSVRSVARAVPPPGASSRETL